MSSAIKNLIDASKEALHGMDGGHDDSPCHVGICSRAECRQCQRVDNLKRAIAALERLRGEN